MRGYTERVRELPALRHLRKGQLCAAHPGGDGYTLSGMILDIDCLYLKRKGMERFRMEMEIRVKMRCLRM